MRLVLGPARPERPSRPGRLRLRRTLAAALLCAGLSATSLPLSPGIAYAAADEVNVERLAGPSRYETAVAIAERYVNEVGAPISTAIVVSGDDDHAACALPAAALAAQQRAPILLTPAAELPSAVATFIERHGISQAVIVGGTEAVSAPVAEQLRRLTASEPRRLAGTSCAEAALAVARQLGSTGVIPGRGRTALVATDAVPADGLAAGPLAYRGRLPLLLAHDGALGSPVLSYLADQADHIIILGGTAAVSEATERQVQALGVTTERWHGVDRFATAARIAIELLGDRSPAACFNGDGVGLATGILAADAIASAPLLGERCDPLLLTAPGSLPFRTEQALGSDAVAGNAIGLLRLTLFGGTAAVTLAAERAAAAAATDVSDVVGPPISVFIGAAEGACHWTVTFSEPVRTADAEDVSNYTIGQLPLGEGAAEIDGGRGVATTRVVVLLAGVGTYTSAEVPTGCATPVAVRDRLGVLEGVVRSATSSRAVKGHELIVRADTARPKLSVLAPPDGQTVWVRSNEPLAASSVNVTLTRGRARMTETATVKRGDTGFIVTFDFPEHDSYATASLAFTEPPWLSPGDKITVASGKLRDWAGNANLASTGTVRADTAPPQAGGVTVSEAAAGPVGGFAVDIVVRWNEPVRGCGLGPSDSVIDLSKMQLDVDGDAFADFSLDGRGAEAAGVSFVAAPDGSEWAVAGTAACDQSWNRSDGTVVARLMASTRSALPGGTSTLIVHAGAAHDFAGNASAAQQVSGFVVTGVTGGRDQGGT